MKIKFFFLALLILTTFHFMRFSIGSSLPTYIQYQYVDGRFDDFLLRFLPLVFSFINLFLIFRILEKMDKDDMQITLMVMLLSPCFIYLYGTFNGMFLPLFFLLLGIYGMLLSGYMVSVAAFIASAALNQRFIFIVLLLVMLVYSKKKGKILFPVLGMALVTLLFVWTNNYAMLDLHAMFTSYFTDFGAEYGLGIFSVILAVIGIIVSWMRKKDFAAVYFLLMAICVMALVDIAMVIFLDLAVSFFAGIGLSYLIRRVWYSEILKSYVVIILICGVVFSSGAYMKRVSVSGPYHGELQSLVWLKDLPGKKVISHYDYGYMISSVSGKEPYTDKGYYLSSKSKEKIVLSDEIFDSRDYQKISSFLKNNQIDYIWITQDMLHGKVWQREDEGILLVLENDFDKIYDYDGVQIWSQIEALR
ncbi:MAG: hypothetical protein NDI94_04505 [Candidatus Woesearchaeota archaeon]|nr:hypothetical protein [Candidatus Woesearchaeota archaeon]